MNPRAPCVTGPVVYNVSSDPVAGLALHWLMRDRKPKPRMLGKGKTAGNETDRNRAAASSPTRTVTGMGLVLSLVCCGFFSLQSLCVRLAKTNNGIILFVRYTIQLILCTPCIRHSPNSSFLGPPSKIPWLVLIGTISSVTVAAEYFSFQNLPLGDATVLIVGTTPVFTGIMGIILLREKWPISEVVAAIFSIGGVVCVARPTFLFGYISNAEHGENSTVRDWEVDVPHDSTLRTLAIVTALVGAFTTALGFLAVRKTARSVNSMTVLVYSSVIGGTGAAVYLCAREGLILPCSHPETRWLLLGIGVAGFMGQVTGTKAIRLQSASTVAMVRYLDVPVSFAYEVLFFRGELNVFSLIGAIIIVIAAITAGLFQLRQERREARQYCPYVWSKRPFI